MSVRPLTAAVLVLALAAPSHADAPPRKPAAAPARITLAEAESLLREVSAGVEAIRGLKFKRPLKVRVLDGTQVRADWKARIDPGDEAELRQMQQVFIQLGLVPRSSNLLSQYLDMAETGVLGYYEPGIDTFTLLGHVTRGQARSVMAHELTHALEDQHYDFTALRKKAEGDADRATAIRAVVEGSAMAVMFAYMGRVKATKEEYEEARESEVQRTRRVQDAPSFTQRNVILPYVLGFTFLLKGKPWEWFFDGVQVKDIEQAYAAPPRSTRQILHPEQYWVARAAPQGQPLTVPDLSPVLGAGWSKGTEGSIGELGLAVMTGSQLDLEAPEAILPSRWTNRAATGVLADLYHHYVNGDARVTLLLTRWETALDAEEFETGLSRGRVRPYRFGVNVLLIGGDRPEKFDALAIAALQGLQFYAER